MIIFDHHSEANCTGLGSACLVVGKFEFNSLLRQTLEIS